MFPLRVKRHWIGREMILIFRSCLDDHVDLGGEHACEEEEDVAAVGADAEANCGYNGEESVELFEC